MPNGSSRREGKAIEGGLEEERARQKTRKENRRKRVRFVVHSVGVAFEWQIDNWSLLSYDWALLSRYSRVHSSISFSDCVDPFGDFQRRTLHRAPPVGSKVIRVTWTLAASVAHSCPKSYSSLFLGRMWTDISKTRYVICIYYYYC